MSGLRATGATMALLGLAALATAALGLTGADGHAPSSAGVTGAAPAPLASRAPSPWPSVPADGSGDALADPPRWRRVLAAVAAERGIYQACDRDRRACPSPGVAAWLALLADLRGRAPEAQVRAVDAFVNARPYRTDADVWGEADRWATPVEFLAGAGDCEDFAILKHVSLRELGFSPGALRLVVLWDARRAADHAVLTVGRGDDALVLDNLSAVPRRPADLPHYRPYYAAGEPEDAPARAARPGDG